MGTAHYCWFIKDGEDPFTANFAACFCGLDYDHTDSGFAFPDEFLDVGEPS